MCVLCRYKEISQEQAQPQTQSIEEKPIEQPVQPTQPTSECI